MTKNNRGNKRAAQVLYTNWELINKMLEPQEREWFWQQIMGKNHHQQQLRIMRDMHQLNVLDANKAVAALQELYGNVDISIEMLYEQNTMADFRSRYIRSERLV
jgi:hypothetical protein